jgi:hypothetical protein
MTIFVNRNALVVTGVHRRVKMRTDYLFRTLLNLKKHFNKTPTEMKTTDIKRKNLFIVFLLLGCHIYGQVDIVKKHQMYEQRIKEEYPNRGKKNADGSYTISSKEQWTVITDANFSYSSTAIFKEPGNLPQPLCETTITVSKNKITIKTHDAVMLSPETSDKPMWSKDGSTYGYICLKPKDPYKKELGCKGGSRTIKNGGIKLMTAQSYDYTHDRYDSSYETLSGTGTSTCTHSNRRIPIHVSSRNRITGEYYGGSPDAASDGLSPYRFDHNQTITYTWDEIAARNNMSKERLIRHILENDFIGVCVGNGTYLLFSDLQYDYVYRFIWNLFGYSEEKVKREEQEAIMAQQARLAREKEQKMNELKTLREDLARKMQEGYQLASDKYREAESGYQSNPEEAYNNYVIALETTIPVIKAAQELKDDHMNKQCYDLLLDTYMKVLVSSYELSLSNPQFGEIFQSNYAGSQKVLAEEAFCYANRMIAMKAIEAQKYEEAISYLDRAINDYTNTPTLRQDKYIVTAYKAYCLSCIGQKQSAIGLIDNVIPQCPDEMLVYEIKGRVLLRNGDKKQAKTWWEKTVLPKFRDNAYKTAFYQYLKEEHIIE